MAIAAGSMLAAKLLISLGADVNARDEFGNTPLHEAAFHNRFLAAKMLLEAGAKIDPINDTSATPAEIAQQLGHYKLASLLSK